MGFQNFEMNCFGVISPKLRRLAKTPKFTLPQIKAEYIQANSIEWQGWNVKNLETLSERSATGMDSERGVYVISIGESESKLKNILHGNDVILKFDGKIINKLSDLQEATQKADLTKQIDMVVFRNQKETSVIIPKMTINRK